MKSTKLRCSPVISKAYAFCCLLGYASILRHMAVLVVMLALSGTAFCDEIHDASQNGDTAKVKSLLTGNPNLASAKDARGDTPLHCAASKGSREINCCQPAKADVNAKRQRGHDTTALRGEDGLSGCKARLLWTTRSVNAKDKNGKTPLHLAANKGFKMTVEFLVSKGAAVNAKDNKGQTPLDIATALSHTGAPESPGERGSQDWRQQVRSKNPYENYYRLH